MPFLPLRDVVPAPERAAAQDAWLLWLWQMFDRPYLSSNVRLAVRFRRLLASHVFKRCGRNFKCFNHLEFSVRVKPNAAPDISKTTTVERLPH
ncbi:MAG: hypothetical protein JSU87_09975 [Gemmatimonadota bacterium]|nr:MAG: hypothetical protein JSU87_09975 [Gemmatimonadota bacterium]